MNRRGCASAHRLGPRLLRFVTRPRCFASLLLFVCLKFIPSLSLHSISLIHSCFVFLLSVGIPADIKVDRVTQFALAALVRHLCLLFVVAIC